MGDQLRVKVICALFINDNKSRSHLPLSRRRDHRLLVKARNILNPLRVSLIFHHLSQFKAQTSSLLSLICLY
jgi:hypothetical protein